MFFFANYGTGKTSDKYLIWRQIASYNLYTVYRLNRINRVDSEYFFFKIKGALQTKRPCLLLLSLFSMQFCGILSHDRPGHQNCGTKKSHSQHKP